MNLHEIVTACHGQIIQGEPSIQITHISNDTRTLQKGALYVPLVGEAFDGHYFIDQAFEKGAVACLTMHLDQTANGPLIYVADTLQALQDLAHYQVAKAHIPIVAVTGSVGKTSTRDMIGAVVASQYKTLKTEGNFNNHIGLPLTILRYQDEEAMVLEMGMNHLGEIERLSQIANPNIAVITNVGTAHIGNLGSRENILKAKLEIVSGLEPNGTLIINADNDLLHAFSQNGQLHPYRIKTFGIQNAADVKAENVVLEENQSHFTYHGYAFTVPVAGAHFVSNALSAIAVGECLNIPYEKMQAAIASFELTKKRMDIVTLKDQIRIIDGSYNANLDSMLSSLAVLGKYENRKIAVLGDMLELGEYAKPLHYQTGEACDQNHIDVLVCIGNEAKEIIKGAKNVPEKHWFQTNQEASAYLRTMLQAQDVVLIKGSNSMHLKEIVEYLKETFKNE